MLGGRFSLEDGAFRVKAMRDGVHGGCFAAGFGFGAVKFSAVGTGGIDFFLGGHWCTDLSLGGRVFDGWAGVGYLVGNAGGKKLVGRVIGFPAPKEKSGMRRYAQVPGRLGPDYIFG